MAEIALWLLAAVLVIAGLAGTIVPAIPGVPLVFAGLWLAAWIEHYEKVGAITLVILGVLAALALAIDFLASALGAKKVGASKAAIAGSVIGAFAGMFFGLPGLLFGAQTHDAGSIKLFKKDVLAIPLCSRGPFREAERILRAHKRGFRVGVVEVEHLPRRGGRASGARWRLIAGALRDLGRCWWSMVVRGEK